MATDVIVTVGAGRDYATLLLAAAYVNTLNHITLDQRTIIHVYEDQTIGNTAQLFDNANTDATRNCVVRPAPGLSYIDLNPGKVYGYPSNGIQLTLNSTTAGSLRITRGYHFEDFRITGTGTVATAFPITLGSTAVGWGSMSRCRIQGDCTTTSIVRISKTSPVGEPDVVMRDCVVISTAGSVAPVSSTSSPLIDKCTIVATGGSGVAVESIITSASRGVWMRNSALAGNFLATHGANTAIFPNSRTGSTNNALTGNFSQAGTGTTYDTSTWLTGLVPASTWTVPYTNLRPVTGSPLLGAADSTAQNTSDGNGDNRGVNPDIGAFQRTAAIPLPSGTITSASASGQTANVAGTQTGSVSGTLSLIGPTTLGPQAIVIVGANYTVAIPAVAAGTYLPRVTFVNAEGAVVSVDGPNIVVDAYTGEPEAPEAAEPTDPPVISSLAGVPTANTAANVNLATTRSGGTIWSVITTVATTPTKVQIKAGQNNTGTAAVWAGSQAVSNAGNRTLLATGLTATATYYAHAYHEHPDGDSNLLSSSIWQQPPTAFAPVITNQPDDITVAGGATAAFTVEFTGTAPVTIQWRKDGANIPGANSATYTTPATTIEDTASQFTVYLSNAQGNATSNAATLTVLAPVVLPEITDQPDDTTITEGNSAVFIAAANPGGGTLAYQWFVRAGGDTGTGSATGGATSNTYTTGLLNLTHNGRQYRLRVTNSAGAVFTDWATVTVVPVAQPISGTITSQTVPSEGQVVIQGTYTGSPTEIFITLNGLSVDVGPVPATFSNGTFGITIQNVPSGTYQVEILMNAQDATFTDVNDVPLVVSAVVAPAEKLYTLQDMMYRYFRSQP